MDISYKTSGQFEDTRFEKIHNVIFKSSNEASIVVAQEIALLIKERKKKLCVRVGNRIFTHKSL